VIFTILYSAGVCYFIIWKIELGTLILDAAFSIHSSLGPGLLESSYEHCLVYELTQAGLEVEYQVPLPLCYKNVRLNCGYRIDILVNRKVIVEVKSIESLHGIHLAQMLTYLRLSGCKLGYLINFNVERLKNGYKHVVLQL
jgi:GxxExxY protein